MLVGLVGYKGSGKGVASAALVDDGFKLVKFAEPLKAMLRALLAANGLDTETIERMIEGDLKEVPAAELNGQSPRHAMQTLGTEWGRGLISPMLWIDMFKRRAAAAMRFGNCVVTDDVRFLNEAEAIKRLGGALVRVIRPSLVVDLQHKSEREIALIECDYNVMNALDREHLQRAIINFTRKNHG